MAKDNTDTVVAGELPAASVFAYLRVSTDAQDVANQKLGVLEYCAQQGFGASVLFEDTASGKIDCRR